ncbi:unnamed protein product [Prorocentrum cordatum]|nr:unnamed protein product [Polarella glacialis]
MRSPPETAPVREGCDAGGILNVPEASRSYSSVWRNDSVGTGHARSALDSEQAWSSLHGSHGQWMLMDLGAAVLVHGVVTQGRADAYQWVTSYRLELYLDRPPARLTAWSRVPGNVDHNTRVHGVLRHPRLARYVLVRPLTWMGHMSMRAAVLTCADAAATAAAREDPWQRREALIRGHPITQLN